MTWRSHRSTRSPACCSADATRSRGAANDYDLFVFDDAMNVLDSGTRVRGDGTQDPLEFVVAGNPTAAPGSR